MGIKTTHGHVGPCLCVEKEAAPRTSFCVDREEVATRLRVFVGREEAATRTSFCVDREGAETRPSLTVASALKQPDPDMRYLFKQY